MEEMTIRYRTEDPIADKRADHAHSIKITIQEMLASHLVVIYHKVLPFRFSLLCCTYIIDAI